MITVVETICDSKTCQRPGCSPEAGCQGHAARERAPVHYLERAQELVEEMAEAGLVLTVEQRPLQPLAMGHYETVVSVRAARNGSAG